MTAGTAITLLLLKAMIIATAYFIAPTFTSAVVGYFISDLVVSLLMKG